MSNQRIPSDDHLVRFCPPSKSKGKLPEPSCFEPSIRDGLLEQYISVNWLQLFGQEEVRVALDMIYATKTNLRLKNGKFGELVVQSIQESLLLREGIDIVVKWRPELKDVSHAGIEGYDTSDVAAKEDIGLAIWKTLREEDVHRANPD